METVKALNALRKAKNSLFKFTDEAGKIKYSNYVRIYFYIALPILFILAFLQLIFGDLAIGLVAILMGSIIAFSELLWLVPPLERVFSFYLENYFWRAIVYFVLSLPCLFSFITMAGTILIVIGSIAYGICGVMGETPTMGYLEIATQEQEKINQEEVTNNGTLSSNFMNFLDE